MKEIELIFDNVRKDFYYNLQRAEYRQETSLQHFILGQLSGLDRLADEFRMLVNQRQTDAVSKEKEPPRIGFSG